MPSVERNGVKLSYRVTGLREPNAPAVLLIHGLGTNIAFWHPALLELFGQRRTVISYDQRGHGYSDMPAAGYTSAELAADAAAVLTAAGHAKADVVAHSYGGSVALQLALAESERVRSIVLLDARIRALQGSLMLADWPQFARWRQHLEAAGVPLDDQLDLDFKVPLYLAGETWQAVREGLESDGFFAVGKSPRTMARYRKLLTDTCAAEEFVAEAGLTAEAIGQLRQPGLALYGSRSPFLPTQRRLAECWPGISCATLPDVGHNFAFLRPRETADAVLGFWDTVALEAPAA